jgi:hypothetical protein
MQMLNVNFGLEEEVIANGDLTDDPHRVETTVFELAGPDRPGLLADVTQLLTTNDCDVRSAAVCLLGRSRNQLTTALIRLCSLRRLLCRLISQIGLNIDADVSCI